MNTLYFEPIIRYNWLMTTYNWQQSDWPHFTYDLSGILDILLSIAERMGCVSGKIKHLPETLQTDALIDLIVEEAIKTSKIEGETLQEDDVRSSIKNHLGLNQKIVNVRDKRAQGISELMLDARNSFKQPLTQEMLFDWHIMLMAGSTNPNIKIGCWRMAEEPMQIISGHHSRWSVHFEAPPASDVPNEMHQFIHWFNATAPGNADEIKFAPVRSAIAHLYFESIHPFDDGNGRIGRVIAEKALSQGAGYPVMSSLSHAINANKKAYYSTLKTASRSNNVTDWIRYFAAIILEAQIAVELQIDYILKKALFFQKYEKLMNDRQLKVVRRMMQAGINGFEGGMSAKKYMKMTGVSKATATRDLQEMVELNVFRQTGSGRSVCYELCL